MSKRTRISNPAFQKKAKDTPKADLGFNLVTKSNSYNAVFAPEKLDKTEEKDLESWRIVLWACGECCRPGRGKYLWIR